jgi:hypothetical protein
VCCWQNPQLRRQGKKRKKPAVALAAVAEVSRTLREAQMRRKTLRFEIQIGRKKM